MSDDNDNLIVPGNPLESIRRILHKVAADTVAETRRKQFAEQWDAEKRERAEPMIKAVERVRDALAGSEDE